MKDAESGRKLWVDTSNRQIREDFFRYRKEKEKAFESDLKKLGIDYISLLTTDDYTKSLIKLFAKRERM